jgi:hypothetical protein
MKPPQECRQPFCASADTLLGRTHSYVVWKIFWTIEPLEESAAASRAHSSAAVSRHPSAPMLSLAIVTVLIPGIGIHPLQMHQLIATCIVHDEAKYTGHAHTE